MKKIIVRAGFFTLIILITIFIFAAINVRPPNPVVGQELTFKAVSPERGPISCSNCRWDFGDGTTISGVANNQDVKHTYKDPGNYTVTINYNGCSDSPPPAETTPVNVTDTRSINVNPANPRVGQEINITINPVGGRSIKWEFGEGEQKTGQNSEKHTYKSGGNYTIKAYDFGGSSQTPVTATVNVNDNRKINVNPAQPKVGDEVTLTLSQAATQNIKWEFGDGEQKTGPPTEKHTYKSQGNYTVKAYDFNGTAQTPITKSVNVIDNRQINVNPMQPKVGDEVTLTLSQAATQNIKWEFGDGEQKTGTPTEKHTYKSQGNYTVKAYDFNGTAQTPITASVNVRDIRRVKVNPMQANVGQQVTLTLEHAAAQSIKWEFGDGEQKTGSPTENHIYKSQGNYTVKAFDFGGNVQTPLTANVNINDRRRIIMTPQNPQLGDNVIFTAQNFSSNNLSWQLDTGPMSTGTQFSHKFINPGNHKITVYEKIGNETLKKETSLNINDPRKVYWDPKRPKAGEIVRFDAFKFLGSSVLWNFGDGFQVMSEPDTKHIFQKQGNYRIIVVDRAGKDDKQFSYNIYVKEDPREVKAPPTQVKAGEEIFLKADNFYGNNIKWYFGDGKQIVSGAKVTHKYDKPGFYEVKAIDRSGKDKKEITLKLNVGPDPRELVASAPEVGIGEKVFFEAKNFYDNQVQWDFGDGIKKVDNKKVFHMYGKTGVFNVKAVDYKGKDDKTFTTRINVKVKKSHVSGLIISGGEIFFDDTKRNYSITTARSKTFGATIILKFEGSGTLTGYWTIDGKPYKLVNRNLSFGQSVKLNIKNIPNLISGLHTISFSYKSPKKGPKFKGYYFVSGGKDKVDIIKPVNDTIIKGKKVILEWEDIKDAETSIVRIADSIKKLLKKPDYVFEIIKENQKAVDFTNTDSKKFFWYVDVKDSKGNKIGSSEVSSFIIK